MYKNKSLSLNIYKIQKDYGIVVYEPELSEFHASASFLRPWQPVYPFRLLSLSYFTSHHNM